MPTRQRRRRLYKRNQPRRPKPSSARGVSPIVGVLVLLAPLLFMAWKARGQKQPEIKSTCCLPVIDESKRPFQALDDDALAGERSETSGPPKTARG